MEVHHAKQTAKKTGRKAAKKHPAAKKKQKVGQAIFRKKKRAVTRPSLHEQESSFPERKSRPPHSRPFHIRKSIGWNRRVDEHFFTKTLEFFDINYQLAQNEDKTLIFENYCDFLNYFDSSIRVQLSFVNQMVDVEEYQKAIDIPEQKDAFNSIRKEYVAMLKNQLAKGNNGLVKRKYITFGIQADSLKVAKLRLERIEADVLSNFKVLGVKACPLNGKERLALLHQMMNGYDKRKFHFDWKEIAKTGMSTKDFIAPDSFCFQNKNRFQMGKTVGAVSFYRLQRRSLPTGCSPSSWIWTAAWWSICISSPLTRVPQSRISSTNCLTLTKCESKSRKRRCVQVMIWRFCRRTL